MIEESAVTTSFPQAYFMESNNARLIEIPL